MDLHGISKGGQTTVYHRYFYPEDVEISVPYVAPLNLEKIDPRLEKFLSKLGGTPENRKLLEGGGKILNGKSSIFKRDVLKIWISLCRSCRN